MGGGSSPHVTVETTNKQRNIKNILFDLSARVSFPCGQKKSAFARLDAGSARMVGGGERGEGEQFLVEWSTLVA